jgi:arylsulfatase A-like enzyme
VRSLSPAAVAVAILTALAAPSRAAAGVPEDPAPAARPSVLLVVVDTLRFDSGYIGTPRHDAALPATLKKHGTHFQAAIAAGNWTTPSMTTLMTGRYASESGMVKDQAEARRPEGWTLAERLRRAGFATGAVVSNPFLHDAGLKLEEGFDLFDARMTSVESNRPQVGRRDARGTTDAAVKALRGLAGQGKPWFLWVHYLEPHGPYLSPPRYLVAPASPGPPMPEAVTDSARRGELPRYQVQAECRGRNDYLARYRASARYARAEVDRLLRTAREAGWLKNTVVVYTSDHGEFLGEQGYWFEHGIRIDPALVRVPLVILKDADEPERDEERVVSQIDVLPTLQHLLGVEGDSDPAGEDLFALPERRRHPILTEYLMLPGLFELGVVLEDGTLVVRSSRERPAAFRRSGLSWKMESPSDAMVRTATAILRPWMARVSQTAVAIHKFPPEQLQRLRALGYLGGD